MEGDSVNQWIDAGELRQLAESLLVKAPSFPPTAAAEAYGSGFIGYAEVESIDSRAADGMARASALRGLSEVKGRADSPGIMSTQGQPEFPQTITNYQNSQLQAQQVVQKEAEAVYDDPIQVTELVQADPVTHQYAPVESDFDKISAREQLKSGVCHSIESPFKIIKQAARTELPQGRIVQQVTEIHQVAELQHPQVASIKAIASSHGSGGQPLSKRMAAFGAWLKESVPAEAFFVCDRNGEIISDEIGNEKLVKVARTLAHASSSASRQVGDVGGLGSPHVKIGTDRILQVIPKRSRFGLVVLGVIVPHALPRDTVTTIAQSLSKTLGDDVSVAT
ncbi:hypothetical protein N9118_00120 [Akkermansiaceae bacterium]|jgi:hypothetical protein|nr:hypothetical protein [Akkermansiaceae bacterium]MDB4517943.1 hypothetical protein [Akkermansiaceae bacterium]